MTIFVVDGQEHRLAIYDKNGIDYSADFIGNTAHGMSKDAEGRYLASPEDLAWWQRVMADHEEMQGLIDQYVERLGFDAVMSHLKYALDADLEDQPKAVRRALQELDSR